MSKRLKSLDEGKDLKIISDEALDRAIKYNATKSKTAAHNQKVLSEMKRQEPNKTLSETKRTPEQRKDPDGFSETFGFIFHIAIITIACILLDAFRKTLFF